MATRFLTAAVSGLIALSFAATGEAQLFCDGPPALLLLTGEEIGLSGLGSEGHPVSFNWYITPPGGILPVEPTSTTLATQLTPDLPGRWSIGLETTYAHEGPLGGLWSSEACVTVDAVSVVAAVATSAPQVPTDEDLDVDGLGSRWAVGVVPQVEWRVDGLPFGACNGGPPPTTPGDLHCTIPGGWLAPGTHTVGLLLTDPVSGDSSLDTAEFEVIEVIPLSVDFTWSPLEPDPGQWVHFIATVLPATPEADFTRVTWDMGDGTGIVHESCPYLYGSCLEWPTMYATDGWYDVSITVETEDESASQTYRVKIGDPVEPPVASFGVDPTAPFVMENAAFSFDGVCEGDCQWSWEFGDGTQSALANPSHVWMAPATYTVSLTVTNPAGVDSTSVGVDVVNCWPPPAPTQEGGCYGGPVDLTAPSGAAWLWNTGAVTQSISALFGGPHWVDTDNGTGCWGHSALDVSLDNCGDPDGDTDLDSVTDARDLAALIPELSDGDGDQVVNAGGGDLTAPGGDVTGDWNLRSDDLLTVLVLLFD